MDGRRYAAEAGLARVVEPAQTQVVHPPDLGSGCHCDVDSDGVKVPEGIIQADRDECAIAESRTGLDTDALRGDSRGVTRSVVVAESCE